MYTGPGAVRNNVSNNAVTVYLNVYDLHDSNKYTHAIGLGAFHTGIELNGNEYTFAGGAGIFAMTPKVAPGAVFRESIVLGTLTDAPRALSRALDVLRPRFGPDDYSVRLGGGCASSQSHLIHPPTQHTHTRHTQLVSCNCNHFSSALSMELLGKPIPGYLNRLASFGSFFSCFLPADMTGQAPVTQEGAGYPPVQRYVGAPQPNYRAFSGEGVRMSSGPTGGGPSSSSSFSSGTETEAERRERIREATLARMKVDG